MSLALLPCVLWANNEKKPSNQTDYHHPDSTTMLDLVEVFGRQPKATGVTRSQVPLNKLPLSISSLSVESLRSAGYISVPEAIRFVPGASFHTSYGAFYQLQVRGFDYTPIILDGMRDERSTINSYPLADLSDVESIEILKGPASVLQGHSSEGGLLSITRRRARAERSFRTRTEYGSYKHMRNTTSIGGKLFGRVNGLAGFSYQGGDGWRHTKDKRLKLYGTLSADYARDAFDLRLSYNRDFYGTEAGLPPVVGQDVYHVSDNKLALRAGEVQSRIRRDARYNNESDAMWHRNMNAMLKWTHKFSDNIRLTEHVSYNDDLIDYFSTEELSYPTKSIKKSDLPTTAPYPYYYDSGDNRTFINLDAVQLTFPLRFAHRAKMFQNQLGLDGHFYTGELKHNFAVGYDVSLMRRVTFKGYADDDVTGPGDQSLVSVVAPHSMGYMVTKFSKAAPNVTTDHGFYLQDVVELSKQLQAMVALRYDTYRYKTTADVATNGGGMDFTYPADGDFSHINSSALTYRLGVVYTPSRAFTVYASLASIFKPERMGVDTRYKYINDEGKLFTPSANTQIFKPRSRYQAEIGLRSHLNKWISLDASAFYIKLNNMVKSFTQSETQSDGSTLRQRYYAQIGSVISKGVEASLTLKPVAGLDLGFGYSLTDARYGDIVSNEYIKRDVATGARLNYVPKHQLISRGAYRLGKGFSGFEAHYNFSYTGSRIGGSSVSYSPYSLLDMGLSAELMRGLRFGVDVYNVLNHHTYISALSGTQMFPNAPRTYKVSLSYSL